jgi:hypothetical protein
MAITEPFESVADQSAVTKTHSPRWTSAEMYVLFIGVAAVAALGLARLVYEPSFQQRSEAARVAMAAEHVKVCDKLGQVAKADRDNCLHLLDDLQATHQRALLADSGAI